MNDLISWLRTQLDQREQQLDHLSNQGINALISPDGSHVLTEVEFGRRDIAAKRRILDRYEKALANRKQHPDDLASAGALLALPGAVKDLAQPYAGRDGWQTEWATTS